eukprot:COSAG02_NODE_28662_length_585_cov_0.952675_2_plen_25_part_01
MLVVVPAPGVALRLLALESPLAATL